jgi:hypothetical protein
MVSGVRTAENKQKEQKEAKFRKAQKRRTIQVEAGIGASVTYSRLKTQAGQDDKYKLMESAASAK